MKKIIMALIVILAMTMAKNGSINVSDFSINIGGTTTINQK